MIRQDPCGTLERGENTRNPKRFKIKIIRRDSGPLEDLTRVLQNSEIFVLKPSDSPNES